MTSRSVLAGQVGRMSFRPVPAVDSAILRIEPRPVRLLPAERDAVWCEFVEYGFTGLGGSLHASLRMRYPAHRVDTAFAEARVDRDTVVAFVHPDRWLTLFELLHRPATPRPGPVDLPRARYGPFPVRPESTSA